MNAIAYLYTNPGGGLANLSKWNMPQMSWNECHIISKPIMNIVMKKGINIIALEISNDPYRYRTNDHSDLDITYSSK